jgi:hypothetical protein
MTRELLTILFKSIQHLQLKIEIMMKKIFHNICVVALMALCALPAMAQLNGSGYYRFRNAQNTSDYISIANDKFNFTTVISTAGGGLGTVTGNGLPCAMDCTGKYLQNDIHLVNDPDIINPGSVIFAKKRNTNTSNYEYNLIGQGTSLLTLTSGSYPGTFTVTFSNRYITINSAGGSGANTLYTAKIVLQGSYIFGSYTLGTEYFVDNNGTFAISESSSAQNAKWYIEPITHFNVLPEVELNGKWYTTIKVPFAFTLSGSVEKAYKITAVNGGVLAYQEISGTIPAGMPVLLQCSSPNAADCRLSPSGEPKFTDVNTSTTTGAPLADEDSYYSGTDNLLDGTYYCNTDGKLPYTSYDKNTGKISTKYLDGDNIESVDNKFVIGKNADGKLGFIAATGTAMPANKAWITTPGLFPTLATPTITPASGTYIEAQTVTITGEEGTTIEYSTDGGNTWQTYSNPITIDVTTTLMARATKTGLYNNSETATASYTIQELNPELAMTPESMTISDAAAGIFTITGTDIEGNINVGLANNNDWYLNPETLSNTGGEVNVTYTGRALTAQNTVNAYVANNTDVTASATVNYQANVYIVTDNGIQGQWDFNNGTLMDNEDGTYTATFTATLPNTYIMFARKLGDGVSWGTRYVFGPSSDGDWWLPADVAEQGGSLDMDDDDPIKLPLAGEYTITINASNYTFNISRKVETVAMPTFSPGAGTFTGSQTVTIACETEGASISYKINDGEYQPYSGPIEVTESCTITAIATKEYWNPSEEATAEYIIEIPVVHTVGDVNHDGRIDVKDVTDLIDYMLDGSNEVCLSCGDIKADGVINVEDITALIDMMLDNPTEE